MADKVYGDFTQEELDWQYNNRERVPEHETLTAAYAARGDAFVDNFAAACRAEHAALATAVSKQERARYLEG